jgi:hypothetical protein
MPNRENYPYLKAQDAHGQSLARPLIPLRLQNAEWFISTLGLLDTGATINVLPFNAGLALGFSWAEQTSSVELAGNLGQYEARGAVVIGHIGQFQPVPLVFAWTKAENVPLILGQVNFFAEFDVCFFWARSVFEIGPKIH